MATDAAVRAVAGAGAERASGGQPSRAKSLLVAAVVGATAATLTYRLLRSS